MLFHSVLWKQVPSVSLVVTGCLSLLLNETFMAPLCTWLANIYFRVFRCLKLTLHVEPFDRLVSKLELPSYEYSRLFRKPLQNGLLSYFMCYLFLVAAAYVSPVQKSCTKAAYWTKNWYSICCVVGVVLLLPVRCKERCFWYTRGQAVWECWLSLTIAGTMVKIVTACIFSSAISFSMNLNDFISFTIIKIFWKHSLALSCMWKFTFFYPVAKQIFWWRIF